MSSTIRELRRVRVDLDAEESLRADLRELHRDAEALAPPPDPGLGVGAEAVDGGYQGGLAVDNEIIAEAIDAMATDGVVKMNAFISKHNGPRDVIVSTTGGYADQIDDAFAMMKRERNLLRAVAKLARDRSNR